MINKTLKKIKETMDVIVIIAKDFSSIVASIVASVIAIVTGYKEIKKISKKTETKQESIPKTEEKVMSRSGGERGIKTTITTPSGSTIKVETGYQIDYNTAIFVIAIIVLPIIWIIRKRNKNVK